MLYVVSGASRAGKSIVAKDLASELGIPYLSLDWLMMGFTNGLPELGIHHLLFPDEIARKSWSFFKAMFACMIQNDENCVIEGEALLPELVADLRQEYPDQLKVCFLGFSKIPVKLKMDHIKNNVMTKNDWLIKESDDYIEDHIKNMILHSQMIKGKCIEYDFKYIDTGGNFEASLRKVKAFLLQDQS